jgi:hypothetical protein
MMSLLPAALRACAMSLLVEEHAVGCLFEDARTPPQGFALGGVRFRIGQ